MSESDAGLSEFSLRSAFMRPSQNLTNAQHLVKSGEKFLNSKTLNTRSDLNHPGTTVAAALSGCREGDGARCLGASLGIHYLTFQLDIPAQRPGIS
jgi:hypothetical protein